MLHNFRSRAKNQPRKRRTINIEPLEARQMLTGMPVISEFMASNNNTLFDENGDSSDWIEIFNSGTSPIDLDGYALTDDARDTNMWEFPPITLESGGYLTVFASNKNRRDPESELHTNFRLSSGGEYLALVAPDGTVMQDFSTEYPPQVTDISYGLGTDSVVTNFIDVGDAGTAIVPADGVLENDWHQPGFDDGNWTSVTTALGYETGGSELGLYGEFVDSLSPVSHWNFDESTRFVAADSTPNKINGFSLSTSREESPIGMAVDLTNTNDDVIMRSNLSNFEKLRPTDELAIAVWVQKTNTAVGDVVSLGDHYRLRLNSDSSVELAFDNSSGADSWVSVTTDPGIAAETVPVDGQWHHIVAQKTSTGLEIWIDGVKSSAELATTDSIDYTGLGVDLYVGRNGDTNTHNFIGKVDDAAIWDQALSTATIVSLFGGGDTPGGYTDTISSDVQADMFGNNASVYLRLPFEVTDFSTFNQLTLFMQYDDGFVAYLNGTEVARGNAPGSVGMPVPFDAEAFDSRPDAEAIQFSRIDVSDGQSGLQLGENILAIQGLNVAADNPDFLLSARLDAGLVSLSTSAEGYMSNPTPGALNNTESDDLGPVVKNVEYSGQPAGGEAIVVTAEITQTVDPVETVELLYRVMFDDEVAVVMVDDGSGSDAVAGDGVFTAVIPGGVANPGDMVRWYVQAADTESVASREPRWVDPTVLDRQDQGSEYFGTMVADPTVSSELPILYWFVENESAAGNDSGTHASLWYNGEFYDNVENHRRGGSTAGRPKTNFKFDFKGETFRFDPNFDRVEEFNLNSTYSDKAYVRQSLAFEAYDVAGAPGSESFPMHVQRNGEFYGVFAFIEEPDATMLEREGLDPNGALYKHYNEFTSAGGTRKKTREFEDNSDLATFISDVNSLNGVALSNYLFDNVNVPLMMNYLVGTIITHQNDNPHKNHFLYRDSDGTGEWTFLPWDHDLTWGSNWVGTSYSDVIYADQDNIRTGPVPGHNPAFIHPSHPFVNTENYREWNNHWNRLMDAVLNEPRMREMFVRRLRTVMDDFLGSPDANADETYFNRRLDESLATMSVDTAADRQRWPFNWGDTSQTFEQAVQIIKDEYLAVRRVHLYETHNIDNVDVSEPMDIISEFVDGVRYCIPTDNSLGSTWTGLADPANIADWGTGQAGLGFEDAPGDYQDLLRTNVRPADACATCTSIYVRIPFEIDDLSEIRDLILRMKYDDGFIAYVNGTEVARSPFLGSPSFDMTSIFNLEHSGVEFQDISITDDIGLLNEGANILAIHSFNNESTGSDQLISPSLVNQPLNSNIENAGIPNEQPADATLIFGDFDANPVSGNQDEEYIRIDNPNDTAIDLTGWRLVGGVDHEFKPGTVIEAGGSLYVSPHVPTFRERATGPSGNQGHFVQGDYQAHLSSFGDTVHLLNRGGDVVSTLEVAPSLSETQQYLRITELNYNPGSGGAEFLEVTNFSDAAVPLDLSGVTISQGFAQSFVFAPGTALESGQSLVIVQDETAFAAAYPEVDNSIIAGQYVGNLDNGGERIKMDDANGSTIMDFNYNDNDPWPARADGTGATLVLIDPVGAVPDAEGKYYSWRASTEPDGTPGSSENAAPVGVVISEVLSNTDETQPDAIELHNTTTATINIGGWYLSDAGTNLLKYQIPAGTELAAGDYIVFDETQFNPNPANPGPNDFALNGAHGDDAWLVISDGNGGVETFVDDGHFRAALVGESFGLDSNGRLVPMSETTLGAENSEPRVGPLVISEVNYNPGYPTAAAQLLDQHVGRRDLEYVEIYNPTGSAVDLINWRLRGGIDMDFDPGTMIASGEALLVLSFNPDRADNSNRLAAFREQYGLDDSIRLVGGYGGRLSDAGDVVRLMRPDTPPMDEPEFIPHTIEDEVLYDDVAPWATAADGAGDSLQRLTPTGYGNTAASWKAALPSPAVVDFSTVPGDLTGDGIVASDDIDALYSAINAGLTDSRYDLDGSSTVDSEDVTYLVETILGTSFGDADLDGKVDAQDLNAIGVNWQNDGTLWASGDFTGDGSTDAMDLNALALNWLNGVVQAAPAANQRVPRAPLAAAAVAADVAIMDYSGTSSAERAATERVVDRIRQAETPWRHTEVRLNRKSSQRNTTGYRRLADHGADRQKVADEATLVDSVLAAGRWGRRSLR